MKYKRGISAIVATMLIILITVSAVGIVWKMIIPLVKNNLQEESICSQAVQSLKMGDVCLDMWEGKINQYANYTSGKIMPPNDAWWYGNITLVVRARPNSPDITNIKSVVTFKDGNSIGIILNQAIPGPNEEKEYRIHYDVFNSNDSSSLGGSMRDISDYAIAPMVTIGKKEIECGFLEQKRNLDYCSETYARLALLQTNNGNTCIPGPGVTCAPVLE